MACQKVFKQGRDDMHESKGEHIGKAPSLHLFHTTFRQCMEAFLKRCLEMRLKPCHVFLQHYQKSVLTVALLHASGTNTKTCLVGKMRVGDLRVGEMRTIYPTETLSLSGLQIAGHSNQRVKLKYLCTALKTTWMGADSALKDAV